MAQKGEIKPNYWSAYKAFNFSRITKNKQFIDKNTGKTLEYNFVWAEKIKSDPLLSLLSVILWMSPAILIVVLSVICSISSLWSFFFWVLAVIAYHFLGMYYCIRWPMIEYKEVKKKKGIFGL